MPAANPLTPETFEAALDAAIAEHVAPHAVAVDVEARFPTHTVDAFGASGLLGVSSALEVGGLGLGPRGAATVVRKTAAACGSSAMVLCMHYAGTAVLEAFADDATRRAAASGAHLSTLAFSERGSRSHFWAPVSTAKRTATGYTLDAQKSWITSAGHAAAYVWSSGPAEAEGASSIFLVPADAEGLSEPGRFDGLGLRGNASSPMTAAGVEVGEVALLGEDGKGFDIMMGVVLPTFQVGNAAGSIGLCEGALAATVAHVTGAKYTHMNQAPLTDLPTIRAYVARMQVKTDAAKALLDDTLTAMEQGRPDAMLRVLEVKAFAGETATEVLDLAMRVCGGAAFRKDVGVERYFRDGRAATVMAPTTDVLYDFIGKAACGLDLF